jgi:hypothetical protein
MTIAEIVLLIAGGVGIYVLLRPLQRFLETYLRRTLFVRRGRDRRPVIDVDFASHPLPKKDDHAHGS